jgi:hypothetical protein
LLALASETFVEADSRRLVAMGVQWIKFVEASVM